MILAHDAIAQAVKLLCDGDLVALPTETVYGLAADASSEMAVSKIFAAKGRPVDHPLIVHIGDPADLSKWVAEMPPAAVVLMQAFWPGPLTLVLRRSDRISAVVTGGQDTVAVRCPAHPVAQDVLRAFARVGSGIVAAPSANRYGHVSPTTALHVEEEFAGTVTVIDGGACPIGIESTIVDVSGMSARLLRPGHITADAVAQVLGVSRDTLLAGNGGGPRVSGSHASHYAPRTHLELVAPERLAERVGAARLAGQRIAVFGFHQPGHADVAFRRAPLDAEAYGRVLYATLRSMDVEGHDLLVVEAVPQMHSWQAIHDRLRRASTPA
jgi:L-threonylcarbamoyladenylate synthase